MKAFQHHEEKKAVREQEGLGNQGLGHQGLGHQGVGTHGTHGLGTHATGITQGAERVVSERTEYADQKKGTVYEARPKAIVYEERPKEDIYEKVPARTVQTVEVQRVVPATGGAREEYATPAHATGAAHTFTKPAPSSGWTETRAEGGHHLHGHSTTETTTTTTGIPAHSTGTTATGHTVGKPIASHMPGTGAHAATSHMPGTGAHAGTHGTTTAADTHHKKGLIEKIKDKLPGHH